MTNMNHNQISPKIDQPARTRLEKLTAIINQPEPTHKTHHFRIVFPLAIYAKLELVLALGQINDGHEVAVRLDHRQRLPVAERSANVNLLSAAIPLEHRRQGNFLALNDLRLHRHDRPAALAERVGCKKKRHKGTA
jgi:hypothetical protein